MDVIEYYKLLWSPFLVIIANVNNGKAKPMVNYLARQVLNVALAVKTTYSKWTVQHNRNLSDRGHHVKYVGNS